MSEDRIDWYLRRHELEPGMVFVDYEDDVCKLNRRVPGDGTQWYVASLIEGGWCYDDGIIEPSDLRTRIE